MKLFICLFLIYPLYLLSRSVWVPRPLDKSWNLEREIWTLKHVNPTKSCEVSDTGRAREAPWGEDFTGVLLLEGVENLESQGAIETRDRKIGVHPLVQECLKFFNLFNIVCSTGADKLVHVETTASTENCGSTENLPARSSEVTATARRAGVGRRWWSRRRGWRRSRRSEGVGERPGYGGMFLVSSLIFCINLKTIYSP